MHSPASTSAPTPSCYREKLETCLGKLSTVDSRSETLRIFLTGDGVCDRLATSSSSVDCADDSEHEFYSDDTDTDTGTDDNSDDDEPDVSRADTRARALSIDRFFASDIRAFREGGSSLRAMADAQESEDEDDDEDEEDNYGSAADNSDSTNARSLVDRILPGDDAPTRYRVALEPSLGAIEEDDESECGFGDDYDDFDGSDSEGVDCLLTDPSSPGSDSDFDESSSAVFSIADSGRFDSIHLSVASFPTLDEDEGQQRAEDDPDFGWVWIEVEDGEANEPQSVPLTRSCEVSMSQTRPLSGLRDSFDKHQAREWRWHRALRRFFAL